ncbi:group 1 truncated hemoglobin [Natronosporangium hydrolyticum]|uniref:Group 1 truncated hemoglobin n=1 Tax=Natronosporangium hydrolyticum TaxID=2811111 RepID=A0A895YIG8_9ACTN|nr:group 1 truncated hemoglobin [Natronosporangium hydrolyticum]QSB15842.1 group 1 truncated hemoglobin [Natronosporangium hydrolyticum]
MANDATFIEPAMLDEIDETARQSTPSAALLAIGGSRAVTAVVEEFYTRLLADPVTAPYFRAVEVDTLKRHQVLMLVKVLGGPDRYTGRDLQTAHAGLGITPEVYARVCLYLLTVMHDFKVPMDILVAANQVLVNVQGQIVTAVSGGDGQ